VPELDRHDQQSLESGRAALISYCVAWKARKPEITQLLIVFDGDSSVSSDLPAYQRSPGIRILFTETGEKADSRILALVDENIARAVCTVVSDDGEVRRKAKLLGAEVVPVPEFYDTKVRRRKSVESESQENGKSFLRPHEERAITESLRKEWGID